MMWLWLCAAVLFGVVEAVTAGLVSVWFAVGSVGAFFAALGGLNVTVQLVIFAAVSAAALAVTRPLVARLGRDRHVPTNLDRVIGRSAGVTEDIDNDASTGAVYVDGKTWTARSADGQRLPAGTVVEIEGMEGVKLIVRARAAVEESA